MRTQSFSKAALLAAAATVPSGIERKDDPNAAQLTAELKGVLNDGRKIFEALKDVDMDQIKELKNLKSADIITVEKLKRVETALEEKLKPLDPAIQRIKAAEEKLEAFEAMAARPPSLLTQDEKVEAAKSTARFNMLRKSVDRSATDLTVDEYQSYRSAFTKGFMRKGGDNLTPDEAKALRSGSDPDGGYMVPIETHGRIVEFVRETTPMRQYANIETIGTDTYEDEYDLDEVGSGWVGETESRAESDTPTVGRFSIPVHELHSQPRATQKNLDDAVRDQEAWLARKVSRKFARDESTAFVSGDGDGKPRGFLTYAAGTPAATSTNAFRVIEQSAIGNTGGAFAASNPGDVFITAIGLMKAAFLPGASWAMNRGTLAATRKVKDGDGTYLWQTSFDQGTPFNLLGYPVLSFEDMPALASSSLSIAFANWREAYTIVDRMGIRVLRDPYTAKPFVLFDTTKRVGGDVVNFEAVKLLKFTTSL